MAAGLAALAALSAAAASAGPRGPRFVDVRADFVVRLDDRVLRLRVHEFQLDTDGASAEVRAERLREEILSSMPVVATLADGIVTAAFATQDYAWPGAVASWRYNPVQKPGDLEGEVAVLEAAAESWHGAGGAPFTFTYGGATAAPVSTCPGAGSVDGVNTVGWGALTGSTLARTCVWFGGSGDPSDAVEFDMQIDPGWEWTLGEPVRTDYFTVIAHEFGHALGLGHTGEGGECPGALMCATYQSGTSLDGPQLDDIAGLVSIYGGDPPTPTPSVSPSASPSAEPSGTPDPSSTPTPTVTTTPTPPPIAKLATLPLLSRD